MSHTAGPASPPQTPVTASPVSHHKTAHGPHSRHGRHFHQHSRHAPSHPFLKPNHHHANTIPFRPNLFRPDDLSPRSSSSSPTMGDVADSDDAVNDADDDADADEGPDGDEDEEMASESDATTSASPSPLRSSTAQWPPHAATTGNRAPNVDVSDAPITLDEPGVSGEPGVASAAAVTDESTGFVLYEEESLTIEEIIDFDSDNGRVLVLRPSAVEEPESSETTDSPEPVLSPTHHRNRHRERTPPVPGSSPSRPDIDRFVMNGLHHLNCGADSDEDGAAVADDDDLDLDESEYNIFLLRQRDEKRRRRMTSGSISKRTISESIGSDTDTEDLNYPQIVADGSDAGMSARRLRRRLDRHSLQLADPPEPRIDELEEPDTSDDDMIRDSETLARELPYYTLEYISMEVDSP